MAVFNGNSFVVKIATGTDTKDAFAHATSASISISNSLIETTTKDSSSWMEHLSGKRSFTVSTDGLVDFESVTDRQNTTTFADWATDGTKVSFTIGNGTDTFDGDGFIDSFEISGSVDDITTYSISITGTGALTNPT